MAERMTFFKSYLEGVEGFDESTQLEILKAILRFGLYGEEPKALSPIAKLAFTYAKPSLEKSMHKAEISRENGNKHTKTEPTETQNNQEKPSETQSEPKKTSDYRHKTIDIDIDNRQEAIDIDRGKDIDIGKRKEATASKRKADVEAVLNAWNSIPGIPTVKVLEHGTDRYRMLCARLDKYGVDQVLEAVSNISRSSFLRGGGDKGWRADFGWFVKPNNFPKVLEGKYTDGVSEHGPVDRSGMIDDWIEKGVLPI